MIIHRNPVLTVAVVVVVEGPSHHGLIYNWLRLFSTEISTDFTFMHRLRRFFGSFKTKNISEQDNSGFIDKSELKNTMKDVGFDLSNRDVDTMMKAAGVANKDKIFYEGRYLFFFYKCFVRSMRGLPGILFAQLFINSHQLSCCISNWTQRASLI